MKKINLLEPRSVALRMSTGNASFTLIKEDEWEGQNILGKLYSFTRTDLERVVRDLEG